MGEGFSFEPGTNIYHDVLFAGILIVSTILSFWSVFYGLVYLFTPDKNRQERHEKFIIRLIVKLLLFLYPMAVFIGLPILLNFMSFFFIGLYLYTGIFDASVDVNYITYFSFIITTIIYLYVLPKKINTKLDYLIKDKIQFYNEWNLIPGIGILTEDEKAEWRKEDTNRSIKMYKIMIHFCTIPTVLLALINFIVHLL